MARPEDVVFPRARVEDVRPVYSTGDGGWSVAELIYDDNPTVGIRWNGTGADPGYPNGRTGKPVWFILPESLHMAVLTAVGFLRRTEELKQRINAAMEA